MQLRNWPNAFGSGARHMGAIEARTSGDALNRTRRRQT